MGLNYIKHKIANLINITKIVTIHYYEFDKNYVYDGESHNFWEMVYIDAGNVKIKANNKDFYLKQGEVIFHKPNEFHTIETARDASANVFVISFVSSSEAMSFFKGKTMTVPSKLKKHIGTIIEEYSETFNSMRTSDIKLELKENPPIGGQQMIKTYLEQFLIMLIRSESDNRDLKIFPSKESMENHLVSQIIQLIEENTYTKISVQDLCDKLNYSRTYISKIFKSVSGYTILEYILKNKIREAKKLIREEKYNFTQISDLLDFDNPHYFSTVFKKVSNMTPTEYKNSAKNP
ncbi:MAG: helix-turn-helix transcriptional regulator [Clostridia bacterium]|nr:helix-turn-helix transcriptional regulator [Clostridia bacterium]MBQ6894179.1 helix-turn-helix transcriptional regulator [Clostridia bacterium]